jgi:glycosyltransferase involved in cell wall biosynthesis
VHKDKLQLVIVGDGPEREIILAEAVAMGLDDLHLPGFMTKPWQFVGLLDIFALSSDSEQFPVSLVEAMAAGCPVVSTDVGDVAHMVAPENRPFIVQPDDEGAFSLLLGELASGAKLRADIGMANRAKARLCFAEADMIAAYAQLYGQAIARPGALL